MTGHNKEHTSNESCASPPPTNQGAALKQSSKNAAMTGESDQHADVHFALKSRYKLHKIIGVGAYGQVCSAKDKERNEKVAIKKVQNVFEDTKEALRTLRELRLLRHFQGCDKILQTYDAFTEGTNEDGTFRDLYIVTEYMKDGDAAILALHSTRPPVDIVKKYVFDILTGVSHIHKAGALHRDLRPKNILLAGDVAKIADFGGARGLRGTKNLKFSLLGYVSSVYYTAPEGLIANCNYTSAVDVWAVGCIMAEFLLGNQLFRRRKNSIGVGPTDQLKRTARTVGFQMDDETIDAFTSLPEYRKKLRSMPSCPSRLSKIIPNLDAEGLDLLQKLLTFNPQQRITAAEALKHPWFDSLGIDEATQAGIIRDEQRLVEFESVDIEKSSTRAEIAELIDAEIQLLHHTRATLQPTSQMPSLV